MLATVHLLRLVGVADLAELLDIVNEFRDGNSTFTDMGGEKKDYMANLSHGKIRTLQGHIDHLLPAVHELYHFMYELTTNFTDSTGSKYPTGYNRGYTVFNDVP